MTLEDSNGTITEAKSIDDVTAKLRQLGSGIDHVILEDGEVYIQTAGSRNGCLVEYQDASGHYTSTNEQLPLDEVIALFTGFFEKSPDWKTRVSFRVEADSSAAPGPETRPVGDTAGRTGSGSLRDTVVNAAQREAQNSIMYMIRRAVRRFFRNLF